MPAGDKETVGTAAVYWTWWLSVYTAVFAAYCSACLFLAWGMLLALGCSPLLKVSIHCEDAVSSWGASVLVFLGDFSPSLQHASFHDVGVSIRSEAFSP